uniref:Uncharacterized protein n=1 Tax=Lactuca sativa TaxID=4236 RepID=A0A9R1US06_LACSA|nr:hypothetical protein LSAT_V11C800446730 [Lactuca sativa]
MSTKNEDPNKEFPTLSQMFERTRKRTNRCLYSDTYDDTAKKIVSLYFNFTIDVKMLFFFFTLKRPFDSKFFGHQLAVFYPIKTCFFYIEMELFYNINNFLMEQIKNYKPLEDESGVVDIYMIVMNKENDGYR